MVAKIQQTDFERVEKARKQLTHMRRDLDDLDFMRADALRNVGSGTDEVEGSTITIQTPNEDLTMDLTETVGSDNESDLTSQQIESSGYDSTKTFTTKPVTSKVKQKVGLFQKTDVASASTPDRFKLVSC